MSPRPIASALDRPPMPAAPPPARTTRARSDRSRFVADFPADDYAALGQWATETGTSRIALIIAMTRLVPLDPGLRVRVEAEAAEYHRASRAR